jgi:sarcosine oxidase
MAGFMDVAVIGAGVFGVWTAHHLALAGARVTLVDAYGPANSKASSGDESRIIRCGYGPDEIYSRWARASLGQWLALFDRMGGGQAPLFHGAGVLWLAGNDLYTIATRETLLRCGYPVERLTGDEVESRFPQLRTDDVALALLEPDCGVLMARRAVQLLAFDLGTRGVRTLHGRVAIDETDDRLSIRTSGGREIQADSYVFACGPWLPKVFPSLLGDRIRPTRQVVAYFGPPPGDERFTARHLPAWIDFAAGIYGIPDLEHRGVKVGIDTHGPPFDPDSDDRLPDPESLARARAWLARRIPALANAPINETRVCQYENTDTGDFLIDRHPSYANIWFAGGGSGHGFKHGPAVGAYVAGLIAGTVRPEPRFAYSMKGTAPRRSIF